MRYQIWQIDYDWEDIHNDHSWRFMTLDFALGHGFNPDDYVKMYEGEISGNNPSSVLETIFIIHNRDDRPAGDRMYSLSMSDIVAFPEYGTAYYVDRVGFKDVTEYFGGKIARRRKADYGSFYGFQEWDDTYGHHRLYDIGSGCFIELLSVDDNDVDWMIFDEFHSDVLAEGHSDSVDGAFADALDNFPSRLLRSVAKKRAMKKRAGDWDYPTTDDEWEEIDRVVDDAYLDIEQWIDDGEVAMGHADVVYDAMAQYGYYLNERQQLLACFEIIKNLMRDGYLVCSGDYFAEWWTRN